ncbi:terminase small subunit [Scandinavium goeteborgense]|uniref:Terminase small subunit n=1 Tax=Scandinavium goeteborgense TaxID=1851514 RepID=A0A4R6EWT5_SCAGO|nr:terminase small subunit [Scandinavium goeteborgense]
MALTDKHEMFRREYLIDLNATYAAVPFARLLTLQNDG